MQALAPGRLSNVPNLRGACSFKDTMNKTCSHCKKELDISEFYQKKDKPSQYSSWCRECLRWNGRRYNSSEKGKNKRLEYSISGKRKDSLKKYNVSDKRKAVTRRYYETGRAKYHQERYKANDPLWNKKKYAQAMARRARIAGQLVPQPCEYSHIGDCYGR